MDREVTLENPTPFLLLMLAEAGLERVDKKHDMSKVDRELGTIHFTTVNIPQKWFDDASGDDDVLFVIPCEVGFHGVGAVKRELKPGGQFQTHVDTLYEVKTPALKLTHKQQHAVEQKYLT